MGMRAFLHSVGGSKSIEIDATEVKMPHELRRVATVNSVKSAFHDAPSLAWSPDRQWLLVTEKDDETGSSSLVLISSDGGKKQLLTHPPAQTVDDNAVFSPNGTLVAFCEPEGLPRRGNLHHSCLRGSRTSTSVSNPFHRWFDLESRRAKAYWCLRRVL